MTEVVAHQVFDLLTRRAGVAHHLGGVFLHLVIQDVLVALVLQVQHRAQAQEKLLGFVEAPLADRRERQPVPGARLRHRANPPPERAARFFARIITREGSLAPDYVVVSQPDGTVIGLGRRTEAEAKNGTVFVGYIPNYSPRLAYQCHAASGAIRRDRSA